VDKMVGSVVSLMIGVILLTALAPTVHNTSCTANWNTTGNETAGCALNVTSSGAQGLYNLYDLFWAIAGLVFIAGGVYGFFTAIKGKK
jgi:hypothetical protein